MAGLDLTRRAPDGEPAAAPAFYFDLGEPRGVPRGRARAAASCRSRPSGFRCAPATSRRPRPPPGPSGARTGRRSAPSAACSPCAGPRHCRSTASSALRATTYAKQIGRVVAFALAAFRQAYAGGRALDDADAVVIAGAGMRDAPGRLLKACALRVHRRGARRRDRARRGARRARRPGDLRPGRRRRAGPRLPRRRAARDGRRRARGARRMRARSAYELTRHAHRARTVAAWPRPIASTRSRSSVSTTSRSRSSGTSPRARRCEWRRRCAPTSTRSRSRSSSRAGARSKRPRISTGSSLRAPRWPRRCAQGARRAARRPARRSWRSPPRADRVPRSSR